MLRFRRILGVYLIAVTLILCEALPRVIERSSAITITADGVCKSMLIGSGKAHWTCTSSQELAFSNGTLGIISGLNSITVHTTIGGVEIPPGFEAAIHQESDSQLCITAIGYRPKVSDPLKSTRSLLVTTEDGSIYRLNPAQQLKVSFINSEVTDLAVSEMNPAFLAELGTAATGLSTTDFGSDVYGDKPNIRMANQWAKSLLSLLGAPSDNDEPNIQVAEGDRFMAIQPGLSKNHNASVNFTRKA